MNTADQPEVVRFGSYEINRRLAELRKHGIRVRLQDQPFLVLSALLERPGELVTREELRDKVWPKDTFVDFDHALNTAVKKVRAALNDDADAPRYVETAPRRGYRFIAPVNESEAESGEWKGGKAAEAPEAPALVKLIHSPWIAAVLILPILAGILLAQLWREKEKASAMSTPGRVMVAVLPFQNMSNDPLQDYFSEGMTEETITQLGRLNSQRIGVIARTSAMRFKNSTQNAAEIGKELKADYILEGSVRREGQRVRIAAQLIHTKDQSQRWAKNFDRNMVDAISLETDVANAIVEDIQEELGDAVTMQPMKTKPVMPQAYDAYLQGRFETSQETEDGIKRGIAAFQKAVSLDPRCAVNWAGLASAYDRAGNLGVLPPKGAFEKTREAALQAIKFDPTHPDAHVYLADAILTADWNWTESGEEIKRALALNPNAPSAHQLYSIFLALQGKPEEGLREASRAWELDPFSTDRMMNVASIALQAGRGWYAAQTARTAIGVDPDLPYAYDILRRVDENQKRYDDAVNEWATALRLNGEAAAEQALKQTYAKSGYAAAKKAALREDLNFWLAARKQKYVSATRIAMNYALLGEKEEALTWLERGYAERDVKILCLRIMKNECFASVSSDPRFTGLEEKIGFPE